MPRAALTDLFLRSVKAEAQTDYWDTKTPAFGVRVGKNSKTFVAKVGNRRITIGRYGEGGFTLAEARRKALTLKGDTKVTSRENRTLSEAYDEWKEAIATKKSRTQRDYKRMMDKYFVPKLGAKRLIDITFEQITKETKDLTESEGAHALAVARTFFRWCVRPPRRYIPFSPLEGLQVSMGKARKRTLKDAELAQVWNAALKQGYPHGHVVRLLILTGQRRGEIAALRWPWINERDKTITLPPEITKNGLEHTFPYDGRVAEILDTIPRLNSTDLLFPSRVSDERPISGWSKYKHELDDGVDGWTLHDLRRTFATDLAELKVPPHIVERLLNHKMGSIGNFADSIVSAVAEVYNRARYLPELREAIDKWDARLSDILRP